MAYKTATPQMSIGLHQLMSLNYVKVRQKTTAFSSNKYTVLASDDSLLFYVKEDASALEVMFGGSGRPFHVNLYDAQDCEVVRLRRPFTWGVDKMEVTVCGQLVSVVRQAATFFKRVLNINDALDRPVLRIKGPALSTGDCDYKLLDMNKKPIGVISKKWCGFAQELFTNSDNYEIHFPVDLDVRYKAVVIGTCIFIDFLYYEK